MSHLFKHYALLIIALFFLTTITAQVTQQTTAADNSVYFATELNGLNILLCPQPNSANILLAYNVKIGPVYEDDTISGISYILQSILSDKIKNYLNDSRNLLTVKNTSFKAYNTPELSVFQLTISPEHYTAAITLLRDTLNFSVISKRELANKLQQVKAEIEADTKDYLAELNTRLKKNLFRKDAYRQLIKGDTASFRYWDLARIRDFCSKYYVPNNVIINVTGSFDPLVFQKVITDTFQVVMKGKFDPQVVTRIVDFKAMIYNTRLVIKAPVQQPEIQICWQFPGTRSNTRSSYYAFLLTAILNDPNNYIQVKSRRMGCRRLTFEYEAYNFSGILKVIIDPDKKNFYQTYSFVMGELQRLDKTLLNESTINAGKVIFKNQFDRIKKSKDYAGLITHYCIYNNETYLPTLSDSVMGQSENRMRTFMIEYLNRTQHVTAVLVNDSDRAELKIDSLLPPLDESANNYAFTYRPNISDIEGTENLDKLYNLLSWLKENPDLEIQINGIADTKEVSRFRDDSIEQFMDSILTFEKSRSEIIKTGYMRLEMLRAMKIIKFLYDHGIEAYRLKGTAMCFNSKTKEEEKDNRVCTLTVDKIIRAPSLFEYHYGKPKEPAPKK